jgi:hypothetical protein
MDNCVDWDAILEGKKKITALRKQVLAIVKEEGDFIEFFGWTEMDVTRIKNWIRSGSNYAMVRRIVKKKSSMYMQQKLKLLLVYPMTTGRNFDEVLRVIDSLQLTAKHKVATPAQWQQGDDVIIAGSVDNEAAKEIWPDGWQEPKPYIRIVPQPK